MPKKKSIYRLPKLKLKDQTVITIATIVSFLLAGVTLAAIVTETPRLLFWNNFLYENIGWTYVFTPVIFILIGLLLQKMKWSLTQPNVLLGLITCQIALMSLSAPLKEDIGGVVGSFIWDELAGFISAPGAAFALLMIFFIGLIVMFNATFEQVLKILGATLAIFPKTFDAVAALFDRPKSTGIESRQIPIRVNGVDDVSMPNRRAPTPMAVPKDNVAAETVVANVSGQARVWKYPPFNLLSDKAGAPADRGDVKKSAAVIERALDSFGIQARVAEVNGGPAVTQYALEISSGTKIAKISNLQHDIALALATRTGTVRIEAPIPGKSLVGIEVPNHSLEIVTLKSVLTSPEMVKNKSRLAVALGKDTASQPVVVDISKMPHCLIAGTTGSGKSSLMNAIINSLIFRNSPDELKLILIDPKRVEFSNYNGIPHLLAPVIVEPEKILSSLKWAMGEMDRRYKLFQSVGVRNIQSYNEMSGFQALPYICILIDELADLMMFAPVEVEDAITRLAQLARAVGIHLILATQRPSVDVITGLMKANIPCRIAFNVSSMIDSRVILDGPGAEKLLGRGDMLFLPPDASKPMRVQGVYVADAEINSLVSFLQDSGIDPQYSSEITDTPVKIGGKGGGGAGNSGDQDDLFEEAVRTICQYDRASASLLQRRLRVGYARAARILDELEAAGVVGPGEGSKPRDVLVRNPDEYFASQAGGDAV